MTPQIGILSAGLLEKCCAGVRRKLQRAVEQLFNPSPTFRIHTDFRSYSSDSTTRITTRDCYLLESSARSQALAIRQSRLAVSNETPRTSAVSSMLNPPK